MSFKLSVNVCALIDRRRHYSHLKAAIKPLYVRGRWNIHLEGEQTHTCVVLRWVFFSADDGDKARLKADYWTRGHCRKTTAQKGCSHPLDVKTDIDGFTSMLAITVSALT